MMAHLDPLFRNKAVKFSRGSVVDTEMRTFISSRFVGIHQSYVKESDPEA